ncbi:hypothetical protein TB1_011326 [Malus domestica]
MFSFASKIEVSRDSDGIGKTKVVKLEEQPTCDKGLDLDRRLSVFGQRNWKLSSSLSSSALAAPGIHQDAQALSTFFCVQMIL